MAAFTEKLGFKRLDTENYGPWSIQIRQTMVLKGCAKAVDFNYVPAIGELAAPTMVGRGNPAVTADDDDKARAYILLGVEDHHLPSLQAYDNANAMWHALKRTHEASCVARQLQLKQLLATLRKADGEPVSKYVARARELRNNLATSGHSAIRDSELALSILAGLPAEYAMFVQVMKFNLTATTSLGEVEAQLLTAEHDATKRTFERDADAYYGAHGSGRGGGATGTPHDNPHKNKTCFNCGKRGHIAAKCRSKKKQVGKVPRSGSNGHATHADVVFTAASHRTHSSGSGSAGAAVHSSSTGDDVWVIDSGASAHITPHKHLLHKLTPLDSPVKINFGKSGTSTVATHQGMAIICTEYCNMGVTNVLYAPDAAANLISVGRLVTEGAKVEFTPDSCIISKGGKTCAAALKDGNMYYLRARKEPQEALTAVCKETAHLWHARLCHLSFKGLAHLIKGGMATGIEVSADECVEAGAAAPCKSCIAGKLARAPFPSSSSVTSAPLELLHMDVAGPFGSPGLDDNKYIATIVDDYSRLSIVRTIDAKSGASKFVYETINHLEKQSGRQVKAMRTDRGREYLSTELGNYLKSKGIKHELTVPYSPQQNGVAERLNRTLLERTRAVMYKSELPAGVWSEAIITVNYARNRSPVKGRDKTPWELFSGKKPDLRHMRVFGAPAFALIPKQERSSKLAPLSRRGYFMGYEPNTKGYRILLDDGKIIVSRDVVVDEQSMIPAALTSGSGEQLLLDESDSDDCDNGGANDSNDDSPPAEPEATPPAGSDNRGEGRATMRLRSAQGGSSGSSAASGTMLPDTQGLRRSSRPSKPSTKFKGYETALQASHSTADIDEPASLEEAMASPQWELWQQAMDDEMASLLANNTWELTELPTGAKAVGLKWVFKLKRLADGSIERFKARLVVKGYMQQQGVDYDEVFAPVSKYATLRAILAYAAASDSEMHQLDIKTAFLNGELEEEVYTVQPPLYEQDGPHIVCHLRRALYGLRQAPRAWHFRLKQELELLGFSESTSDPGLFIRNDKTGPTYILVYVDDLLIVTPSGCSVTSIKENLMAAFDARDLGEVTFFLGMSITRDRANRQIRLAQPRMAADLLAQYGMTDAKNTRTPLSSGVKLSKAGEALDTSQYPYSALIGSLMYMAVCTRPDIAQSVGALARYMAAPTIEHWQAAKSVLRYLAGTAHYGITYGGSSSSTIDIMGYCDSDFASDSDTRRSTTGYVFTINGGAVSWSSRRQQTVAASTTEAEYMAAAAAVKEALWLRKLLRDLGAEDGAIPICADNQGTIKLLKNPVSSMRSKHIDVMHHFARERVARAEVNISYIRSEYMLADYLTKAVPAGKHEYCCRGMGLM